MSRPMIALCSLIALVGCVPEIRTSPVDVPDSSDLGPVLDLPTDLPRVEVAGDGAVEDLGDTGQPDVARIDAQTVDDVDIQAVDVVDVQTVDVVDVQTVDVASSMDVLNDASLGTDASSDRTSPSEAAISGDVGSDTSVDDRTCGVCAASNAVAVCDAGICQIESCAVGFGDCNGRYEDGCEQGIQSDSMNCGRCGRRCVGSSCVFGSCAATSCPAGMVLIPSGSFSMGWASGEPTERPVHPVEITAFCLDATEVTVAAYASCSAPGCTRPAIGPTYNWGVAGRDNHPVNGVDWFQAVAYCNWRSSASLPTEAQWEYAARGTDGRPYPWGFDGPSSQVCWSGGSVFRTGTCPVRSFLMGNSPFGVSDMAGNVWEWTLDWAGSYPVGDGRAVANPVGPVSGVERVYRGGQWFSQQAAGVRATTRASADPRLRDVVGFRCALGGL